MFSRFFIERPVFAVVVSTIIVLAGLMAMRALPIEQYPTIMPVQVTVNTMYAGADSQTVAESVAAPIEAQINGVDNMLYMTSSSSSTGQLTLTVFFSLDTDPDVAQVQVQNRVNLALPQLPQAVTHNGVQVQKKSSSIMMLIAVKGAGRALHFRVHRQLRQRLRAGCAQARAGRGPGADPRRPRSGDAHLDESGPHGIARHHDQRHPAGGAVAERAVRCRPDRAAADAQTPVELSFPVVTQRPFTDPAQYENMILRASSSGSAIVRLKDVARAEVGPEELHRRFQAQRRAGDLYRGVPAARRQCAAGIRRRARGAGADGADAAAGDRDRHRARHDRLRAAVDQGSHEHAVRGHRAGGAGRVPVPAELPRDLHLHRRRVRRAGRAPSAACMRWDFR